MRAASVIELTDEQRQQLRRWSRSNTVSVRLLRRAQIILMAAQGMDNTQIAMEMDIGRVQVGRWRKRFAVEGLAGIGSDLPRCGRKRRIADPRLRRHGACTPVRRPFRAALRGQSHDLLSIDSSVRRIWR